MVLDFKFLSEKEVTYIIKDNVSEQNKYSLDYKQILNSARERDGKYIVKVENKTLKIDKITGEVT